MPKNLTQEQVIDYLHNRIARIERNCGIMVQDNPTDTTQEAQEDERQKAIIEAQRLAKIAAADKVRAAKEAKELEKIRKASGSGKIEISPASDDSIPQPVDPIEPIDPNDETLTVPTPEGGLTTEAKTATEVSELPKHPKRSNR